MFNTILLVGAPNYSDVEDACRPETAALRGKHALVSVSPFSTPKKLPVTESRAYLNNSDSQDRSDINIQTLRPFQAELRSSSPPIAPEWRVVQLTPQHLTTGLTQKEWPLWTPLEWAQRSFVKDSMKTSIYSEDKTDVTTSFGTELDDELTKAADEIEGGAVFLERSFALHNNESDAPITPAASFSRSETSFDSALSTISSSDEVSQELPSSPLAPVSARKGNAQPRSLHAEASTGFFIPAEPPLSLVQLPSAGDVLRAMPATLTANLLVCVAALEAPRPVTIRKTGRVAYLAEAVVSDDTGTGGFGISFWLNEPPSDQRHSNARRKYEGLRKELENLRVGDVVLITTLALSQWRGRVQGTSLARMNWRTKIGLVWRRGTGWTKLGKDLVASHGKNKGVVSQNWQQRALEVKDWAKHYVVPEDDRSKGPLLPSGFGEKSNSSRGQKRKFLPDDDTQEG